MKPLRVVQSKFIAYWVFKSHAIVLYPFIFMYDKTDKVILNHERIHEDQMRRHGVLGFYIRYLLQWIRVGFKYRKIPFEVEAYKYQEDFEYLNRIRKGKNRILVSKI